MARPKRPLPPNIGKIPDRIVALQEAERGYHTTPEAIKQLRYRRGIPTAVPKGWPNERPWEKDASVSD